MSQYSQENTFGPATLLKRDSNTGVSCEYFQIFKNTYFEEYFASVSIVNLPLIFSVLIETKMSPFSIFSTNAHRKKWKYYVTDWLSLTFTAFMKVRNLIIKL